MAGRNDPCPCGSGRKYKKCHQSLDEAAQTPENARARNQQLDSKLVEELIGFAKRRLLAEWIATLDPFVDPDDVLELSVPWSLFASRIHGKTIAEHFIEERAPRLSEAERSWLAAQRAAWLSVWEVRAVEPGVAITFDDLLSGETRRVLEETASRSLVVRDVVLARIVDHAGVSILCGMYPRALPPASAAEVVRRARGRLRRKGVIPTERLRDDAMGRYLITRWEEELAEQITRARQPITLSNFDGDPFILTTDHFDVASGADAEVAHRLAGLDGVEQHEAGKGESVYDCVDPQRRSGAGPGRVSLAQIRLRDTRLRIETTSRERADAMRLRVEEACGDLIRHRGREYSDPLSEKAAELPRRGGSPPQLPPDEAQPLVREWKQRYYADWIDQPVPALGGSTPREAARTRKGRVALDLLLKEFEHHERHGSAAEAFDFAEVRRELGI